MDAFWCITLLIILLHFLWKSRLFRRKPRLTPVAPVQTGHVDTKALDETLQAERIAKEKKAREDKDIADLKKQGYTDELIAVILPTLHNDG